MRERERTDAMLSGVLIALAVVYEHEPDPTSTMAQVIVDEVGAAGLLRVAKKEEDSYLPMLRKTVKSLPGRLALTRGRL